MISNALDIPGILNPKSSGQATSVTTNHGEDGLFELTLQESQAAQNMETVPVQASADDLELPSPIAQELASAIPGQIATIDPNLTFDMNTLDGNETLRIVLMSILAVGKLAQRVDQNANTVSPTLLKAEQAVHMVTNTFSPSVPGSRSESPRIWLGQAGASSIAVASQMSREADAYLSRSASGPRVYERVFAALLPPRENLLIVSTSDEKRVFVRNFFSPDTALECLRGLDQGGRGALSNAHVYVNGNYKGRM